MDRKENVYYKMMYQEITDNIKDEFIREFAYHLLDDVPEYFFSVPASSSGKYHPVNDLGLGGLVRHSITVERMLKHLFVVDHTYFAYNPGTDDILLVAGLFHDCMKSGTQLDYSCNNQTKFLHPVYAANFIITESVKWNFSYKIAKQISDVIMTHMGQWNTSKMEKGNLPLPETHEQELLHLADYLASRKDINMTLPNPQESPMETHDPFPG